MTTPKFDIIVYDPGAIFLDLIFEGLPSMPELGKEIFAKNLTIAPGGCFNAASALAKLGLKVAIVALIGDDQISKFLEFELKKANISTDYLIRKKGNKRAITASMTFPEDRAFVSYVDEDEIEEFPMELLENQVAKAMLVCRMVKKNAHLNIIKKARENSIKVAMDPHLPSDISKNEVVKNSIKAVDIILPNSTEVFEITQETEVEAATVKLNQLTKTIVKNGSKGSLYMSNDNILSMEPIDIEVVDTTGAGDCFNAGFLYGWINGEDISECAKKGNICGGLAASKPGGSQGAPDLLQLQKELEKYSKQ